MNNNDITNELPPFEMTTRVPWQKLYDESDKIIEWFPLHDPANDTVEDGFTHVDMRGIRLNMMIGDFAPCMRVKIEKTADEVRMVSRHIGEHDCNLCLEVVATEGDNGMAKFVVSSCIHLQMKNIYWYRILAANTHKNIVTRLMRIWEYRFLFGDTTQDGSDVAPDFTVWKNTAP